MRSSFLAVLLLVGCYPSPHGSLAHPSTLGADASVEPAGGVDSGWSVCDAGDSADAGTTDAGDSDAASMMDAGLDSRDGGTSAEDGGSFDGGTNTDAGHVEDAGFLDAGTLDDFDAGCSRPSDPVECAQRCDAGMVPLDPSGEMCACGCGSESMVDGCTAAADCVWANADYCGCGQYGYSFAILRTKAAQWAAETLSYWIAHQLGCRAMSVCKPAVLSCEAGRCTINFADAGY